MSGRKLITVVLAQALALGALAVWAGHWDGTAAPALAATAPEATPPCQDSGLSYRQPFDVPVFAGKRQTDFDCFSWRSLVALNWPASRDAAGQPDTSKKFGQPGDLNLVVWQTFKPPEFVFLPTGDNPCPECPYPPAPDCLKKCWNKNLDRHALAATSQVLSLRSKVAMSATRQAVPNVWLTDQDKNLVRYEIRINEPSFTYLVANKLYNGKSQKDSKIPANFPIGESGDKVGGISIKAAWKVLVRPEDRGRYFSMDATIQDSKVDPKTGYDDPKNGVYLTCGNEGPLCRRTVGLVGFHIAQKAKDNQKWVWSTFEHEDNAPLSGSTPARGYSFYDPRCVEKYGQDLCKPNQNPQRVNLVDMRRPVQVTRLSTPDILPDDVNAQWRGLVKGTPWEHYVLVSTQWIRTADGAIVPEVLSNTTMETYIQDRGPRTASCIKCHSFAATLAGKTGDFVYLISNAQPRK